MAGPLNAIIMKVAAHCNLNCSYCYVYNHEDHGYRNRPAFMSDVIFDRVIAAMKRYCDTHSPHAMSIAFHGGEPTLMPTAQFARMAQHAREVLGDQLGGLSVQTNAIRIDDDWIETFRRFRVDVGVSLDGPASIHDATRVDHRGTGSHARTVAGLTKLRNGGIEPGILCVINPSHSGLDAYRYFRRLGLSRIDFLPPDVSHDNKTARYGGLGDRPVADYLIPVFDEWFDADDATVRIRLFWELLRQLKGGRTRSDHFGNPPMTYLILETNGDIEALDALRVCQDGITRSGLNVMTHGFDDLAQGLPLVNQAVHGGFPLCATCQRCPEQSICGGGYLPHRFARANGFDNPSVWCNDLLALIAHVRSRAGL